MSSPSRLGLREAAAHLGVHYMTVYRYVRTGRLPAERDGATWSVALSDLERLRLRDEGPPRTRGSRQARSTMLLGRMAAGDEHGAWSIIEEALASGHSASDTYTELLVPTLRTIGERWERGQLSVADEHRASAVATRLVGRLGPMFSRRGLSRGVVVVGAPEGDFHALPSAILADLLRARGFEVLDLGANAPATSFVESAKTASRLLCVLVGCSSSDSVARVAETVTALRLARIAAPVYVGGGAVGDEAAARDLGADGWSGADGRVAVGVVEEMAASSRRIDG